MLSEIGFIALIAAFVSAIYAIVAALWGERTRNEALVLSGRNAVWVNFAMLLVATGALQIAILSQDYTNAYAWSVSNPAMPEFFRWTALWGSQAGSLLFWSFLMGAFTAASTWLNWRSHRRLMPYAMAAMMAVVIFFLGLSLFLENPFERWWILSDGAVARSVLQPAGGVLPDATRLAESAQGLNPLLRHFGMAIHPPMLYLGFVGFIIPFAFGVAALASGDLSTNWIKASRRWALVAWLFLSLGLLLGGRWAYDVLGWGGYWGWDPVENAAFLPWLMGTAFLHSVMMQEKRGMLKVWNMFLVVGTFSAVIFGTFATRSGLVESVHSFARSEIGFPMFAFWFLMTLVSVALILHRRSQGLLRDEHPFQGWLSREVLFVLNNLIFMALFIAIFWGSFGAPIFSELVMNTKITLGLDYFLRVTPPLFLALFILMGVAPISAWGATSLRRMGISLLIPVGLTIASLALFILSGVNDIGALVGYGFVLLAAWVAIYETLRGYQARRSAHGARESAFASMGKLITRNPRRYGGYLIHLGVTVIGLGVIGSTLFQLETQRTLGVGESLSIGDYQMRYDRFEGGQVTQDGRIMDIAVVSVFRDGQEITQLRPRRDFFPGTEGLNSMTIAGAHSTIENDFYVILVGWDEVSQANATFKVYVNPLINLVWWGGLILILGTMISTLPMEIVPARTRRSLQLNQAAAPAGGD